MLLLIAGPWTLPRGSYPTPFWGDLVLWLGSVSLNIKYLKTRVGYEPLGIKSQEYGLPLILGASGTCYCYLSSEQKAHAKNMQLTAPRHRRKAHKLYSANLAPKTSKATESQNQGLWFSLQCVLKQNPLSGSSWLRFGFTAGHKALYPKTFAQL